MVQLQWWSDLHLLVVQFETIEDSLLLVLNFPGSTADAVARGDCRDNQLSVFHFEALCLAEGDQLHLLEGTLDIL